MAVEAFEGDISLLRMLAVTEMTGFHAGPSQRLRDVFVDRFIPGHVSEVVQVAVRALKLLFLERFFVGLVNKGARGLRRLLARRSGPRHRWVQASGNRAAKEEQKSPRFAESANGVFLLWAHFSTRAAQK
jgi:hypothetical protein